MEFFLTNLNKTNVIPKIIKIIQKFSYAFFLIGPSSAAMGEKTTFFHFKSSVLYIGHSMPNRLGWNLHFFFLRYKL